MFELMQNLIQVSDPHQMEAILPADFGPSVHFYWKDRHGILLGSNASQAQKLGFESSEDLVGYSDFDFAVESSALVLRSHDEEIISAKQHKIFFETAECLNDTQWQAISCKMPLKTTYSKKVCGIMGMSIVLDETNCYELALQLNVKQKLPSKNSQSLENIYALTSRQIDCLYYLVKGMGLKEIAAVLRLSPRTIEHHFENIKLKMDCNSRSALTVKALQLSCIKQRL